MVVVEVNKLVPAGFFAYDDEVAVWVSFKYEKLPLTFCCICGRIGHVKSVCGFKSEGGSARYGDWTRAGIHSPTARTPRNNQRGLKVTTCRSEEGESGEIQGGRDRGKRIVGEEEDMSETRRGQWERTRGTLSRLGRGGLREGGSADGVNSERRERGDREGEVGRIRVNNVRAKPGPNPNTPTRNLLGEFNSAYSDESLKIVLNEDSPTDGNAPEFPVQQLSMMGCLELQAMSLFIAPQQKKRKGSAIDVEVTGEPSRPPRFEHYVSPYISRYIPGVTEVSGYGGGSENGDFSLIIDIGEQAEGLVARTEPPGGP
ncbi:hypothetical protein LINGRAHAP2_LOCUS34370 [Linum grandiflorum]